MRHAGSRSASSPSTRSSAVPNAAASSTSDTGGAVEDRVGVAGDTGRHRRGAARGGLGDRHAPALVRRRRGERPTRGGTASSRSASSRRPGRLIQSAASPLDDLALERVPLVALPHDHRPQAGWRALTLTSASIRRSNRFTGHESPDGDDQRRRLLLTAGRERRVDAGRHDGDVARTEPQLVDDLVLRRLRQASRSACRGTAAARPGTRRCARGVRAGAAGSSPTSCRGRGAATPRGAGAPTPARRTACRSRSRPGRRSRRASPSSR